MHKEIEKTADKKSKAMDKSIVQKKANDTGLPENLKTGVENLSGYSMDDVKVYRNSSKPAQFQAHAYAQGTNIYLGAGQEKHLPHEAWHVVQQKQGRVQSVKQFKGEQVNDDSGLEEEADRMGARVSLLLDNNQNAETWKPGGETSYQLPSQIGKGVVQGAFTYAAAVELGRVGAATDTTSHDLDIDSIALPESFRPPTQYGKNQQAHSVAWTLIKQGYTRVKNKKVNTFITDYLIHDWAALRSQTAYMYSGDSSYQYQQLNQYLETYDNTYLVNLRDNQGSSLEIQNRVRQAISEYFIALQLAPLTTHTGYMMQLDKVGGLLATKPESHGEPAANKKLLEIENTLNGGSMANDIQKGIVVDKAKAYWDPGAGMIGGINNQAAVSLIADKFESSFSRVYPEIWRLYSAAIIAGVRTPTVATANFAENNYGNVIRNTGDAKETGRVNVTPVLFHAQIQISRGGMEQGVPARDLLISEISLPDDRPDTQFGDLGQKSHTVAWTLTLKALTKTAKNKNLAPFLSYMLHRWTSLQDQNWNRIKDNPTYGKTQSSQQTNMENIQRRYALIQPAINDLTTNLNEATLKSDLEWNRFLQKMLSEYVEVFASAPLTTYADGQATGHGEGDANYHVGKLEADPAGHGQSEEWSEKFTNEFSKNNPSFESDTADINFLLDKQRSEQPLSPDEMRRRNELLVRQLTMKFLDIKWNAFQGQSNDQAIRNMRVVLREWESSIKEAYPDIWSRYASIIMEVVNSTALAPLLKSHFNKENMSDWTEELHQQDALTDASNGNESWVGSPAYTKAKKDYFVGLVDQHSGNIDAATSVANNTGRQVYANQYNQDQKDYIQGLINYRQNEPEPDMVPGSYARAINEYNEGVESIQNGDIYQNKTNAFNKAKLDYEAGLNSIRAGDIEKSGYRGFNQAKTDYENGLASKKAGNQDALNRIAGNLASQDYEAGINFLCTNDAVTFASSPGTVASMDEYKKGIQSIHSGDANLNGSPAFNKGKMDYCIGLLSRIRNEVQNNSKFADKVASENFDANQVNKEVWTYINGINLAQKNGLADTGVDLHNTAINDYRSGLNEARSGTNSNDQRIGFYLSITEYNKGLNSIRNNDEGNYSLSSDTAKIDYKEGVDHLLSGQDEAVRAKGFNQGEFDVKTGIKALDNEVRDERETSGFLRAQKEYVAGVKSFQKNGELVGGGTNPFNVGQNEYQRGIKSIGQGNVETNGSYGFRTAKGDYQRGLEEIRSEIPPLKKARPNAFFGYRLAKSDYVDVCDLIFAKNWPDTNNLGGIKAKKDYEEGREYKEDPSNYKLAPKFSQLALADYLNGIESIQKGDETLNGTRGFNIAKQEYNLGLASIQDGDETLDGTRGFILAKQLYTQGLAAIQRGDDSDIDSKAYRLAKQEYKYGRSQKLTIGLTGTFAFMKGYSS
jgi:hypothetical protein